jgi:hypothetical protein
MSDFTEPNVTESSLVTLDDELKKIGAGEGIRTLDPNLGNDELQCNRRSELCTDTIPVHCRKKSIHSQMDPSEPFCILVNGLNVTTL